MSNILNNMGKRAVILQKPSGTIAIAGNLEIREQKFYNGFLKVAKETVLKNNKEHWFSVPLAELKKVLNVKENDKNNTVLKKIIKKMHKIDLEYNVLGKDKNIEGYSSLLNDIEFRNDKKTGKTIVKYSLPEIVRLSMIEKGAMYASIDLVIIKGLRSKYSVRLYEFAKDYINVQIPKLSIEEFRKIFGLYNEKGEKKYKQMTDMKKRVIDYACNEINNNSNIDFCISYKLEKHGRVYTHIKFQIQPANMKLDPPSAASSNPEPSVSNLIDLIPLKSVNSAVKKMVMKYFRSDDADFVERNIRYTLRNNPKNFAGYLSKALKFNYGEKSVDTVKIEKQEKIEEKNKNEEKRKIEQEEQKIEEYIQNLPGEEREKIKAEALDKLHKKFPNAPAKSATFGELSVEITVRKILRERLDK